MSEANNKILFYCTECGKLLTDKIVWLEFDQRINTYTVNSVPEEYSQGGFPFGGNCAKKYQEES